MTPSTDTRPAGGGLTLSRLLAAVGSVIVLALVVPAAIATRVNQARLQRVAEDEASIARSLEAFHRAHGYWPATDPPADPDGGAPIDALYGPGRIPLEQGGNDWHQGRLSPLSGCISTGVGADPWGNHYLVNIRLGRLAGEGARGEAGSKRIWVLSAGPNGIIETPFEQDGGRAAVGGDDVATRVR
jgi:type II secretory pathway pseudopilin PulG